MPPASSAAPRTAPSARRVVALVLDGLRRDFVSPETTPALAALRRRASWFAAHRTVFPSLTRVVSASFATGCRPASHGLAGNTIALAEDGQLALHDVGRPDFIDLKRRLTGSVLGRPTLAARLATRGGAVIVNNVSPGAAYLHDPEGYGHVFNRAGSFGPGRRPLLGAEALVATPDLAGDRIATDRFIAEMFGARRPAFGLLWLCEPDTTQHAAPLGSAAHRETLKAADAHAAMVIAAVEAARAAGEDILLMVGSDHGHQSIGGVIDIEAELIGAGLKAARGSRDVLAAPNGTAALIYVDAAAQERIPAIAAFLSAQPWVGQVFAPDAFATIGVPAGGGLALAVALAASDEANGEGVPGISFEALPVEGKSAHLGFGSHGGLGRFEQSPTLLLDGGGFAAGRTIEEASSIIDLAPTFLHFLGAAADGVDGRALQNL